jgi:hypothetical protein
MLRLRIGSDCAVAGLKDEPAMRAAPLNCLLGTLNWLLEFGFNCRNCSCRRVRALSQLHRSSSFSHKFEFSLLNSNLMEPCHLIHNYAEVQLNAGLGELP